MLSWESCYGCDKKESLVDEEACVLYDYERASERAISRESDIRGRERVD